MNDTGGLAGFLWRTRRRDVILIGAATALAACLQAGAFQSIVGTAPLLPLPQAGIWPLAGALLLIKLAAAAKAGAACWAVRVAERHGTALADRLARGIAAADLTAIEALARDARLAGLGADIGAITDGISALILTVQSAALIAACLLLLLPLAPEATMPVGALLTATSVIAAAMCVRYQRRRWAECTDGAGAAERRFIGVIDNLLSGFKVLKADDAVGDDFAATGIGPATRHVRRMRILEARQMANRSLSVDFVLYSVLGAVAFILPNAENHGVVAVVLTTLAYLTDRIGLLATHLPTVRQADIALARITGLLHALPEPSGKPTRPLGQFNTIELRGLCFRDPNRDSNGRLRVGPINLRIGRPEIILITGGNGAGKSTLLKLLTGLYQPDAGSLLVDGRPVSTEAYRGLFSAVFSDYHLFPDTYGLARDPREVTHLLNLMGLQQAVRFHDGRFSSQALPASQRRRLALVVACLEHRPILVLDEWTADQDPEIRRAFHTRVLPELKAQGRTIIAVTHDDRYFDYGDRLIRIDSGRIVQDRRTDAPQRGSSRRPADRP